MSKIEPKISELDVSKLDNSEILEIIKQKDLEIKNLKISLQAQVNISSIATNEVLKLKGITKEPEKREKQLFIESENELKKSESQFKTRKFA